jgi:hypothetical protein
MADAVHHPAHYGGEDNPYEVIKVLEAWLTPEELRGFCKGNAIKYVARAGKKGDAVEDIAKARWYVNWLVEHEATDSTYDPNQVQPEEVQ